jgi:uncharacterized protein DUF4382
MARLPYGLVGSRHCLTSVALAALLVASSTCADGGTGTPAARDGLTRVLLTDAPFPYADVARADLFIMRVSASKLDGPDQTIVEPNRAYDLVALQNGRTADLGAGVLTLGEYTDVKLTIDPDRSSITLKNGTVLAAGGIVWPSAGAITFPAWVEFTIEIARSGSEILIDVDLARTFRPLDPGNASSGFVATPTASAIERSRTATLRGTVLGDGGAPLPDATVKLYVGLPNPTLGQPPSYTGALWRVARTDPSGAFVIAGLLKDRPYYIAAEGPIRSGYGWTDLTRVGVTSSNEMRADPIRVPHYDPASLPGIYVLRWVGTTPRALPVLTWPGPTQIFFDADTLTIAADGSGSEVRVDRIVSPGQPPGTPRITRTAFSYNRVGRALTILYPCPAASTCDSPQGVIDPGWLILHSTTETSYVAATWPRAWQRVGP